MVTDRLDEHDQPSGGDGSFPSASTQDVELKVERDETRTRGSKGDDLHGGQNNTSGISSNLDDGLSGGRTCRGCLYFSKSLKENGIQAPICVGISKFESYPDGVTVRRRPSTTEKHLKTLETEFKYACVGYSLYSEATLEGDSDITSSPLPLCSGIEFVADRRLNDAGNSSAPHNEQKKRDPIEQRPDTAGIADELKKLAEEVRESQEMLENIKEARKQPPARPFWSPSKDPEKKKAPTDFTGRFVHTAELIGTRCYTNGVSMAKTATNLVQRIFNTDRGRR